VRVGFGTACITPPLPCRLAGFARRQALSRAVASHLWARSLVLDDGGTRVGWVVCDLLEVPKPFVDHVRAAVEARGCLDGASLMVSATHTHAGPDVEQVWAEDGRRYEEARAAYRSVLPQLVASSVVSAVTALSEAEVAWGEGEVVGVGAPRREASRAEPQRLSVLTVSSAARLVGLRMIYACHGTVLGPSNLEVSGDLVGAGVQALETATGAAGRCSWAQGAAGDISTRWTRRERSPAEVRRLGSVVADAARQAAARAKPMAGEPTLSLQRSVVALPLKGPSGTAASAGARSRQTIGASPRDDKDRSEEALLEEAAAAVEARRCGLRAEEEEAEVTVLRVGEMRLCLVPGEPFASVERALVAKTGPQCLRVVGYSNGAPGYVFGPEEEAQGGYEVAASPLTGGARAAIVGAALELMASVG
jgi:neutral ceramidase